MVDNHSDQKFLEINRFNFSLQLLLYIGLINDKLLACVFVGTERYFFYDLLDESMESTSPQIFSLSIHLIGLFCNFFNSLHKMIATSSVKTSVTFSV